MIQLQSMKHKLFLAFPLSKNAVPEADPNCTPLHFPKPKTRLRIYLLLPCTAAWMQCAEIAAQVTPKPKLSCQFVLSRRASRVTADKVLPLLSCISECAICCIHQHSGVCTQHVPFSKAKHDLTAVEVNVLGWST